MKKEMEVINENLQRWKDFYRGAQFNTPHEVPPMILLRKAFVKHIERSAKIKTFLTDNGVLYEEGSLKHEYDKR